MTTMHTPPRRLAAALLVALAGSFQHAPQLRRSTALQAIPIEKMEAWTREYYAAARDSRVRNGESLDQFLGKYDYFDDDYVLTGPDVGPLCKRDFVATQRGFTLDFGKAIPDLDYLLDGFHVDPDNADRVWFTLRYVGTNDGQSTNIGEFELKPTGNQLRGGPELHSIWWTPDKRIKWETVGYSGCRFTGTNQGYGGLAGLLIGIGVPRLVFDVVAPFGKYVFALSQFNEATETGGRACSPASDLPSWWNRRTELGVNVRR